MFQKRGVWTLYVPQANHRPVQRSTNTTNKTVAGRMERMVKDLRDARRWDVLNLITAKRVTVADVYDAYVMRKLDAMVGRELSPRVGVMVDGWLKSLECRETTKVAYERQVLALFDADERVTAITPGSVRDALAALAVTGGTRRTYFAALSSFCHYLVSHELLAVHPMAEKGRVPRPKRNPARTTWMTADEDERLCLAAPSPYREYFALVHGTGAERNAALGMTRADVDLDRWEVRIPGTKTATRDRRGIPVDAWARPIVARFVRSVVAGPLFPTLNRNAVNYQHVQARKAAGLPGYQLRDARHSVAIRWLILEGLPIWDVAERLGHSDSAEALKTYTKTVLREAAKRLGATITATAKEA